MNSIQSFQSIKNEIIEKLYQDADIKNAISKMHPVELQDDLKQEIFLVICEMPEEKLIQINERKELKFLIVRIMLNMIKSDRSTFYNKFRKQYEPISENFDLQDNKTNHSQLNQVHIYVNELHWYEKELFNLYTNNGKNAIKLSKETKIPYRSLINTINKVKKILKQKIRNHDAD